MQKSLIPGLLLLMFCITTCDTREMINPFDENCPKEIFSPSNLNAKQVDDTIVLDWSQENMQISGFIINRNIDGGVMEEVSRISKTDTTWYDSFRGRNNLIIQ